jgi:hypothetical protein
MAVANPQHRSPQRRTLCSHTSAIEEIALQATLWQTASDVRNWGRLVSVCVPHPFGHDDCPRAG